KQRATSLATYIEQTFKRGGNVVIPSFAVGRTQEILYLLRHIITHKMIKGIDTFPVFLDSPLAIRATEVFGNNIEGYFDEEAMAIVKKGDNPLRFPSLIMSVTSDDSKAINNLKESAVIISASGMCEAGRIKHHLKHNLYRKESTIVFCGYQANGTLGRSILDGAKKVKIFGEQIEVRAEVVKLEGISGHADQKGLIKWIRHFTSPLRHVFVVHGDESVSRFFAGYLHSHLDLSAWAPKIGQSFDLLSDEFPKAEEESVWVATLEQLHHSTSELEEAIKATMSIVNRMKAHSEEAMKEEDSKASSRISGAMDRLMSEIDELNNRWGG
ncbi:MAG: MBL fold metallo-hydrolase, partial [Spirochaetia bacterium]|nr:MBL fold metallo-hydrolase [Spirochaetia bacterium]